MFTFFVVGVIFSTSSYWRWCVTAVCFIKRAVSLWSSLHSVLVTVSLQPHIRFRLLYDWMCPDLSSNSSHIIVVLWFIVRVWWETLVNLVRRHSCEIKTGQVMIMNPFCDFSPCKFSVKLVVSGSFIMSLWCKIKNIPWEAQVWCLSAESAGIIQTEIFLQVYSVTYSPESH